MPRFCPECGTKQHNDNNHFCSNCGFDFSKIENDQNNSNLDNSDDSFISVPISSDDDGSSSSGLEESDSKDSSSSKPNSKSTFTISNDHITPTSTNETKTSSTNNEPITPSSTSRVKTSSSSSRVKTSGTTNRTKKNNSKGFLSDLSFNKCFFAFAALLIILSIIGMLAESTQTEPYSDDGLTSFMESSSSYDLSSFLDDTSYDDSYDYVSYDKMINPRILEASDILINR